MPDLAPTGRVAAVTGGLGGIGAGDRWGTPEGVRRAVATMAAGYLPFTTGAAIQVDSGKHIHSY